MSSDRRTRETVGLIGRPLLARVPAIARLAEEYSRRQWSREDILATQRRRLVDCLTHAVSACPAYRDLGVERDAIAADPYAALANFPVLNKQRLQDEWEAYVADGIDAAECAMVATSGSTGTPVRVIHDSASLENQAASTRRQFTGLVNAGDRYCRVVTDHSRPPWRRFVDLVNTAGVELGVLRLTTDDHQWDARALDRLAEFAPAGLGMSPSDLSVLLSLLEAEDRTLPSLRAVWTGGENLPVQVRNWARQALGVAVLDVYGMQEVGHMAWACRVGNLHIDDERVVLETVAGSSGRPELVVTALCNRAMPLIRYRTSDEGTLADDSEPTCGCGRALRVLEALEGRNRGFVVLRSGRMYSPKPLKLALTELPLRMWQLRQRVPGRLELDFVPTDPTEEGALAVRIRETLTGLLSHEADVEARASSIDALLSHAGGKKFQMLDLTAAPVAHTATHPADGPSSG